MRQALDGALFVVEDQGGTATVKSDELEMEIKAVKLEGRGICVVP